MLFLYLTICDLTLFIWDPFYDSFIFSGEGGEGGNCIKM